MEILILGLVFVWVFINLHRQLERFTNKEFNKQEFTLVNISNSMFRDNIDIITSQIKNQILYLYNSDYNRSGDNSTKIALLLNRYVMYEDTSKFLEDRPEILEYIFKNSS